MKLVEILAEELKEWPEGYTRIVQTNKEITLPIDNTDVGHSLNQWDYYIASTRIYDAEFETSELADDYQTAIVTKEMWEAEKAKLNAQNTTIEAESFNPIYCRDRIKEIDSLVESLEEERVSLVQALEDEGFSLVIPKPIQTNLVEDMSDWKNWKEGDLVKFISVSKEDRCFHVGGVYEVSGIHPNSHNQIRIVSDDENDPNGWCAEYFRWYSRPQQ